jgi:hypothetical protein
MNELFEELKAAERTLDPCECGGRLLIRYQPGLTIIGCIKCGVMAKHPDWAPWEIVRNFKKGVDGLS